MCIRDRYIRYHDEEWGVPVHDDRKLFEMLVLECFQAGLSWECVLNKREAFREAFDGFDVEKVCDYKEEKLEALRKDPGIIRNRLKIQAAVTLSLIHIFLKEDEQKKEQLHEQEVRQEEENRQSSR